MSFPASPYSTAERQLREIEAKHPALAFRLTKSATKTALPIPPRTVALEEEALPEVSSPMLAEGTPVMKWLEGFLPTYVEIFLERLSRYMEAVGETRLTRRFTEQEFEQLVVRRIHQKFPRQISGITVKIRPNGFIGSGTVQLGILSFPVKSRIGVVVVQERPHAVIHEIKIGNLVMPKSLRKILEKRINETIDRSQYPLKITKYDLQNGYAEISVEILQRRPRGGYGLKE